MVPNRPLYSSQKDIILLNISEVRSALPPTFPSRRLGDHQAHPVRWAGKWFAGWFAGIAHGDLRGIRKRLETNNGVHRGFSSVS